MDKFYVIICANPNHKVGEKIEYGELPTGWFQVIWKGDMIEVCSRDCILPALEFKLGQ